MNSFFDHQISKFRLELLHQAILDDAEDFTNSLLVTVLMSLQNGFKFVDCSEEFLTG